MTSMDGSTMGKDREPGEKVVVYIEDEPEMIDMVRIALESYGYHILSANGGREGMELVKRVLPDAVLLDLLMPEVDGWQVYRELKWESATENIPIVVITAKKQPEEAIAKQFPQGIEGYILKPFGPYEIVEVLERIFSEQEPQLSPAEEATEVAEHAHPEREERIESTTESIPEQPRPLGRKTLPRSSGLVLGIKKTIAFFVAVVYLLRYAASFISSSFRDKT